MSSKIPYQVIGESRPTTIYIFPDELSAKIEKYRQQGLRLAGPGIKPIDLSGVQPQAPEAEQPEAVELVIEQETDPTPRKVWGKGNSRPIVCVTNGRLYLSIQLAHEHTRISHAMIGYCCRGLCQHAKGLTFRYASEAEIKAGRMIGETVPRVKSRTYQRSMVGRSGYSKL